MKEKTCCFIGHREIADKERVKVYLDRFLVGFIKTGFTRFLFGGKGDFNNICLEAVTELKKDYPEIVRVAYLKKNYSGSPLWYEEMYHPDFVYHSGKAVYIEINQLMINESDYCFFYYDKDYEPKVKVISRKYINAMTTSGKSGTAAMYKYALKKKKASLNIFELMKQETAL